MDRRDLLRGAAALAAMRFLSAEPAKAGLDPRPHVQRDPFPLGVASGEPASDGFVLWTRVIGPDADSLVGYEIAEDEHFRTIVWQGRALALAARGGAVHLEVAGLPPGRPYFYRFHLGGAVSRTGRTATIATDPQHLRLALTSCQHWEQGWFTAYRDMQARGVDAVLQVGDYIYEKSFGGGPDVRSFGTAEPRTLQQYRDRYALYRTDPDLAAAHATFPFIVSWDDHEVENDYAGTEGGATADPAAFLQRRAAAYQAYFEHMPLRPGSLRPNGEIRLYRQLQWGRLATVHMLDTRQYRTAQPCAASGERGGRIVEGCRQAIDPAATMLGAAQEQWLRDGLAREQARWSLITQQTLFSRLFLPSGPDTCYSDIWDGYAATRDRVLAALHHPAVRNAAILGGDVHSFWINDVKPDFDRANSATVATEIVTSCLASRSGPEALFGSARELNPHLRFIDNAHAGYVLLDIVPAGLSIDLRAVSDLTDPAGHCHRLASFFVEDGRPGVTG
ncbi:MAG TPA: alkaline phosphatase D family protein [Rhizorhapis sp.]|nr:alkaline phosphatase D family protein [Rhizorhapis sp.]